MKKIAIVVVALLAIACSKKKASIPSDVLKEKEMEEILTDIHLAQAAASNGALVDSSVYNAKEYVAYILESHNLKREDFLKSLKFYSEHPDLFLPVYDSVLVNLQNIENESQR